MPGHRREHRRNLVLAISLPPHGGVMLCTGTHRQAVTVVLPTHDAVIHKTGSIFNILHRSQRVTEPQPLTTCTENFITFGLTPLNM